MKDKEKKGFLNKNIGTKKKRLKYPSKTTINLVVDEQKEKNKTAVGWFVVYLVLLVIFTKFAVLDPMHEIDMMETRYQGMQTQLNAIKQENEEFDRVKEEFDQVTEWYLSEDEANVIDKYDVFKMIDDDILEHVKISSVSISGNIVNVVTEKTTLQKVAKILEKLQDDERNNYVTITTASASEQNTNIVTASIVIRYGRKTLIEDVNNGGDLDVEP